MYVECIQQYVLSTSSGMSLRSEEKMGKLKFVSRSSRPPLPVHSLRVNTIDGVAHVLPRGDDQGERHEDHDGDGVVQAENR